MSTKRFMIPGWKWVLLLLWLAGGGRAGAQSTIVIVDETYGIACAYDKNTRKYGYLLSDGRLLLPFVYEKADRFWTVPINELYAFVKRDGYHGVIRPNGAYIMRTEYDTVFIADGSMHFTGIKYGFLYDRFYNEEGFIRELPSETMGTVNRFLAGVAALFLLLFLLLLGAQDSGYLLDKMKHLYQVSLVFYLQLCFLLPVFCLGAILIEGYRMEQIMNEEFIFFFAAALLGSLSLSYLFRRQDLLQVFAISSFTAGGLLLFLHLMGRYHPSWSTGMPLTWLLAPACIVAGILLLRAHNRFEYLADYDRLPEQYREE